MPLNGTGKSTGRIATLQSQLDQRILILDGATGTMIQDYRLDEASFRGDRLRHHNQDLKGNNDILTLTQPDIIQDIHRSFLRAGADIIETNTFNATSISQSDYGTGALTYEINRRAAEIAQLAAAEFETADKPRFVAGALGPTNRTASISPDVNNPGDRNVSFDELADAYNEAIRGLVDGGADILLIETIFDTLNSKAAIYAAERHFLETGQTPSRNDFRDNHRRLRPHAIRSNCRSILGIYTPRQSDFGRLQLRSGSGRPPPIYPGNFTIADIPVSIYPNAGLPNEFGEYDDTPEELATCIGEFAESGFLNLAGGCCGTTPDHIAAIADTLAAVPPRQAAKPTPFCTLSGLEPLRFDDVTGFVNIGERTNVAGSARFRKLILEGDYEAASTSLANKLRTALRLLMSTWMKRCSIPSWPWRHS